MPPATIVAYKDHGKPARRLDQDVEALAGHETAEAQHQRRIGVETEAHPL